LRQATNGRGSLRVGAASRAAPPVPAAGWRTGHCRSGSARRTYPSEPSGVMASTSGEVVDRPWQLREMISDRIRRRRERIDLLRSRAEEDRLHPHLLRPGNVLLQVVADVDCLLAPHADAFQSGAEEPCVRFAITEVSRDDDWVEEIGDADVSQLGE